MFGQSYRGSDDMNDATWLKRAYTKLVFCVWPRRCFITDKLLWFTYAYRATRAFSGVADTIYEDRWYDKNEFLILRLKGIV